MRFPENCYWRDTKEKFLKRIRNKQSRPYLPDGSRPNNFVYIYKGVHESVIMAARERVLAFRGWKKAKNPCECPSKYDFDKRVSHSLKFKKTWDNYSAKRRKEALAITIKYLLKAVAGISDAERKRRSDHIKRVTAKTMNDLVRVSDVPDVQLPRVNDYSGALTHSEMATL